MAPWQSRPLGTQVARNRVRSFGLLKPHTVPARIVSPLSVAFSTLSAFQVESVEQPWGSSRQTGLDSVLDDTDQEFRREWPPCKQVAGNTRWSGVAQSAC